MQGHFPYQVCDYHLCFFHAAVFYPSPQFFREPEADGFSVPRGKMLSQAFQGVFEQSLFYKKIYNQNFFPCIPYNTPPPQFP